MILRWLLPLGLFGLVSIAALIVVYLFRPQYRRKVVSGTVVWKRVLLHEKKRRLAFDHALLFCLQALVFAAFSLGLAAPHLYSRRALLDDAEYVIVLDASASMRARTVSEGEEDGETRFSRAVAAAKSEISELFSKTAEGTVSLIVAGGTPTYLFSDRKKADKAEIFSMLDGLSCTLGEGDAVSALTLAGSHLEDNPHSKIFFYTDEKFGSLGTAVEVVDVSDKTAERNVAVLGCTVGRRENQYAFELVLGAYGDVSLRRNISMDIRGADNGQGPRDLHLEVPVSFSVEGEGTTASQTLRVTVSATNEEYGGQADWFFDRFDEVEISIPDLNDSIPDDDRYLVYGGIRDRVAAEYWSKTPKVFWQYGFNNLGNNLGEKRTVTFQEVYHDQGMKAESSGYDFYIFEHTIPSEILASGLPRDGVSILVDPDETLAALTGLSVRETVSLDALTACEGYDHPLLRYMTPAKIGLTEYKRLDIRDELFEPVLTIGGDPVMLVKNEPASKIVVLPFSINMSDFYGDQFQIFLYNLLDYFLPLTLQKSDFTVGESAQLSCKGETLEVSKDGKTETFSEFPAGFTFSEAGTYAFTTRFGLEKEDEVRWAYAHAPASESELFKNGSFRLILDNRELTVENGMDILPVFAIAALLLMAVEWCIQYKYIL